MKREIIIADNQDITSVGLKTIIVLHQQVGGIYFATTKADIILLLTAYPEALVILDYTLFDFTSFSEFQITCECYPLSSWMLFSDELTDRFYQQLQVNNLVVSIQYKSASLEEIRKTIDRTFDYQYYINSEITDHLRLLKHSEDTLPNYYLTNTEKEILKEIAIGKTTKQIAQERNLSVHTITTHRKNIFRKLNVNNLHEATRYAIRAGLVDPTEYYI